MSTPDHPTTKLNTFNEKEANRRVLLSPIIPIPFIIDSAAATPIVSGGAAAATPILSEGDGTPMPLGNMWSFNSPLPKQDAVASLSMITPTSAGWYDHTPGDDNNCSCKSGDDNNCSCKSEDGNFTELFDSVNTEDHKKRRVDATVYWNTEGSDEK
jgi:hypothetical protein